MNRWKYHESFNDEMKNMYRTNYHDFMDKKPVTFISDFPCGYSGYQANLKHDIIHRNTSFEKTYGHTRDPSLPNIHGRFRLPDFKSCKEGKPGFTENPKISNEFNDLCINIGGKKEFRISKNSPWGLNDKTFPLLNGITNYQRPTFHR